MMYGEIVKMGLMPDGRVRVHAMIDIDGIEEYATMEFDRPELPFERYVKGERYGFHGVIDIGGEWRFTGFSKLEKKKPKRTLKRYRRQRTAG